MLNPLVSVVIPFYNNTEWLEEAVNSVLNQTYKQYEIIIVNDGSKENIEKLKLLSPKIEIIYKKNGGPASARNEGIKKSLGKYVAFLDADDKWHSIKLEKQIEFMENENYVWSQHSYEMFWDNNLKKKIIDTSIFCGNVYKDCYISFKIQTSTVIVLKEVLLKRDIYFPVHKRYGQDGVFYRRLARDYPLGFIKGVYSGFRIRGSNAGFRAKIQIKDKSSIWNEIKNDKSIVNILPKPIRLSYQYNDMASRIISVIEDKATNNEEINEKISRVMYSLPYVIHQIYAISRKKRRIFEINKA